ncbi:hypothetical protein L3Q82_016081 [Scortum barcoo]|uniref:Uncharacterized protein n=1 Tax=Scortum barcoo TaxID=214431 RepID=A0ACB8VQY5_9TELE|nr:hypothetical protein L3Q82_016081 [Scortum barcoo]
MHSGTRLHNGRQPVLAIMYTAMIKTILVKECYSVFTNKRNRVDFMQLLVDAQTSDKNKEDTGSYKAARWDWIAYNLATHPAIQKILQKEIDETLPEKGQPTYEALIQMEYLDMVINESMRLYPIANRVERMSKASVEVNGVTIPKGTVVMVSTYPLHPDPDLWPEPEAFKPEQTEGQELCTKITKIPFGAGPRNCISMRFALLMMKLALVEVLLLQLCHMQGDRCEFISICGLIMIPLELGKDGFLTPKNPIKLKLKPKATVDSGQL